MTLIEYRLKAIGIAILAALFSVGVVPQVAASIKTNPLALIQNDLTRFRSYCPDETLYATAVTTPFGHGIEVAVIKLTSSRGSCFGQMGENDFLAATIEGHWKIVIDGGPGILEAFGPEGGRGPRIDAHFLVACNVTYTWPGGTLHRKAAGCDSWHAPDSLGVLTAALRRGKTEPQTSRVTANESVASRTSRVPASAADPIATVRTVIDHIITLPCWCDKHFSKAVAHYATPELIQTVEHGRRVAGEKQIDLWDADFFTGSTQLSDARLVSAQILTQTDDVATVIAEISTKYSSTWQNPSQHTFQMKFIDGEWRIDDIQTEENPSMKRTFAHPRA